MATYTTAQGYAVDWARLKYLAKSTEYHGYCQRFVYRAVQYALDQVGYTGYHASSGSAIEAKGKYCRSGTSNDYSPPAGAACYFSGTPASDGKIYGHVALSAGDGYAYDPISTVKYRTVKSIAGDYSQYYGWGWDGGINLATIGDFLTYTADESYSNMWNGISSFVSNLSTLSSGLSKTSNAITTEYGTYSDTSSSSDTAETVEIYYVTTKSETGTLTSKNASTVGDYPSDEEIFLLIENEAGTIYRPYISDEITVTWERTGTPGRMKFSMAYVEGMEVDVGNAVAFRYKGSKIFFGYIFTLERSSDGEEVDVTCYDQLRYFKNHDTFTYNMKYSELLKWLCERYGFSMGEIEDTTYTIPERLEDGSLFDICSDAAGFTTLSNGNTFVLYDDFGKICLKNIKNMTAGLLIDEETSEEWKLKDSIDSEVYNRIVVYRDDSTTGERGLFIANDGDTQKKWGVLTMFEQGDENSSDSTLNSRAKSLLKYYDRVNRSFTVSGCLGCVDIRGGSSLIVYYDLGNGEQLQNLMIVDKVEHTFSENQHTMDLTLYGGTFAN